MSCEFRINRPSGFLCTVRYGPACVRSLRAAIEAQTGIAARAQRLICGTQEITEYALLADFCSGVANTGAPLEVLLLQRSAEQVEWLEHIDTLQPHMVVAWLREAPAAAREDRDVVMAAVRLSGIALQYASPELRSDREVVLTAMRGMHSAFQYVTPELRADREVVSLAATRNGYMFKDAAEELKADRDFVLKIIAASRANTILRHASTELRADREVVLAAVGRYGDALAAASPELQEDREVVLRAVRNCGNALKHAAMSLRGDREVVLAAVACQGEALAYASQELQADRRVVFTAVVQGGGPARQHVHASCRLIGCAAAVVRWSTPCCSSIFKPSG